MRVPDRRRAPWRADRSSRACALRAVPALSIRRASWARPVSDRARRASAAPCLVASIRSSARGRGAARDARDRCAPTQCLERADRDRHDVEHASTRARASDRPRRRAGNGRDEIAAEEAREKPRQGRIRADSVCQARCASKYVSVVPSPTPTRREMPISIERKPRFEPRRPSRRPDRSSARCTWMRRRHERRAREDAHAPRVMPDRVAGLDRHPRHDRKVVPRPVRDERAPPGA